MNFLRVLNILLEYSELLLFSTGGSNCPYIYYFLVSNYSLLLWVILSQFPYREHMIPLDSFWVKFYLYPMTHSDSWVISSHISYFVPLFPSVSEGLSLGSNPDLRNWFVIILGESFCDSMVTCDLWPGSIWLAYNHMSSGQSHVFRSDDMKSHVIDPGDFRSHVLGISLMN